MEEGDLSRITVSEGLIPNIESTPRALGNGGQCGVGLEMNVDDTALASDHVCYHCFIRQEILVDADNRST